MFLEHLDAPQWTCRSITGQMSTMGFKGRERAPSSRPCFIEHNNLWSLSPLVVRVRKIEPLHHWFLLVTRVQTIGLWQLHSCKLGFSSLMGEIWWLLSIKSSAKSIKKNLDLWSRDTRYEPLIFQISPVE